MKKIIYIIILNIILILNANAQSHNLTQVNELNKLFNDLSKINNIQDGDKVYTSGKEGLFLFK